MNDAVTLALIAIIAAVIPALFKLLNDNTKAVNKMAESNGLIANATIKGNNEAKQRNGHLGEQNIQLANMLAAQTIQLSSISNTLTSSAKLLVKDTETAFQATEEVRKTLKKNRAVGPFTISGNLT